MSTYYGPDEPAAIIFAEKTLLDGAILSTAAYGVHFTLFVMCFRLLWREPKKTRRTWGFLAYITMIFILGTLYCASVDIIAQYTFIDFRNFPGGPDSFAIQEFSLPLNLLGNVTAIMGTWFADALLLWRATVFYRGTPWLPIVFFPALVFLGSFTTSICLLVQISQPNLSLWSSLNFSLPYFTLSLSMNIIVAIIIAARLLSQRRAVVKVLGPQHARNYVSIAAMIVESAALYAVVSIIFLVTYGLNHPIQNIWLQLLPQVEFIAPLLIIFRVASGQGWSSETNDAIVKSTIIEFAPKPNMRSRSFTTSHGMIESNFDANSFPTNTTRTVQFSDGAEEHMIAISGSLKQDQSLSLGKVEEYGDEPEAV